jgi:hypothetical protein
MGKTFDYNETSTLLMRRTSGVMIRSFRLFVEQLDPFISEFEEYMEKHHPKIIKEEKWGLIAIPRDNIHFLGVELIFQYDPSD